MKEKERKLLFFSKGETCEPCKEVQEYLDDRGIEGYTKINPFEEIDLSIQYEVKVTPTLVLLEDGKEIKRVVGGKTKVNPARFDKLIEMYYEEYKILKDIEKTLKDLSKEQDSKYKVYTESLEFLERLDKEFKRKYNNGD